MNTRHRICGQVWALLTALTVLLGLLPTWAAADSSEAVPTPAVVFTFTDSGITASNTTASGYSISGTTLTLSAAGTYGVTGSCAEGNIVVKASTTGVKLVMEDLTLSCSTSAPLLCKKASGVTLYLSGASTLTDAEDPDNENSADETVADAFEGAAVKVNKDGASLLIKGSGTLTADGSNCKNGIKAGAQSTVTVSGGTLNINAANNGLAADGAVIIKGGTLNIDADNDGIKASPDDDDTASAGTITIYDGDITINAESDGINATGDIAIYGGTFQINAQSDGIQTDANLTISDGDFTITTLNGYNSSSFNSSTMSCKGLKASSDVEEPENTITITGGTFSLNTADDAIHSDAYAAITGGTFSIRTRDDGVHADTTLILGTENGTVNRDPDITITSSYEGLEAGTVNIYSGRYYVCASDDGINAAGGSGNGTDPGGPGGWGGGGDHFNPGGGWGGRRMMSMARLMAESSYSLTIAGGDVYVNAAGDGLDSNGTLTLSGGDIVVWGPRSGTANAALDADGTILIKGASVFAAGASTMIESPSSSSQTYYAGRTSISAGALVTVKNSGGTTVFQDTAPNRAVDYVIYSTPNLTSSNCTVSTGSGTPSCAVSHSWNHTWTSSVTSAASGLRTYTCSVCGETETQTIPMPVTIPEDEYDTETTDEGYAVTFATDGHCTINVYYTQDYTAADETNVASTVSRDGDTGEPDSTGDGQINFQIVPASGYTVGSVTATSGTYKNIKGPADTGEENVYRITKISADTTVTVTMTASGESGDAGIRSVTVGADAVSVVLTEAAKSGSALLVAAYTGDGQFLRIASEDCDGSAIAYQVTLDTSDAAYVKAFLLSPDQIPSCEAGMGTV